MNSQRDNVISISEWVNSYIEQGILPDCVANILPDMQQYIDNNIMPEGWSLYHDKRSYDSMILKDENLIDRIRFTMIIHHNNFFTWSAQPIVYIQPKIEISKVQRLL